MKLTENKIVGSYIIEQDTFRDDRGSFTRFYDKKAWLEHGLVPLDEQFNLSTTARKGTLRGLHYQTAPNEQVKLIRCLKGKIFCAIVDMRDESPSYRAWFGIELTPENGKMLYVPPRCANGFLILEDDTVLMYPLSAPHDPASERGIRYDDPAIGIEWPTAVTKLSEKDAAWPHLGR